MAIAPGQKGLTVRPLVPYGRIELAGEVLEAKAESGWIDEQIEVIVVESGRFGLVVREYEGPDDIAANSAETRRLGVAAAKDDDRPTSHRVPLDGPAFWMERFPAPLIGGMLWSVIGGLILLTRFPLGLEVVLLPVGGAMAGAIFQYFIRGTRELAGPYGDHRLKACLVALSMLLVATIATAFAIASGAGVAGATAALIGGVFCGAAPSFAA